MLDDDHVKKICKIGQGAACCRYLTAGRNGWSCEKKSSLKIVLDARVLKNEMNARGDNCEGYSAATTSYRIKEDRLIDDKLFASKNQIVYLLNGYDYGSASEDTAMTGQKHVSVTLNADESYPFFTCPLDLL